MPRLIIGLGNPGEQYAITRHNVGFMAVDALANELDLRFSKKLFIKALVAEGNVDGQKVILAKPTTYMNHSGQAVKALMKKYRVDIADLIVVYDDVDIELGEVRQRDKGSAGGHNGMKSIIQHLGTQEFPRLRIGVGSAPERMPLDKWVLGKFIKNELEELPIDKAVELLKS